MKPVIYVCNVDEDSIGEDNDYVRTVRSIADKEGAPVVVICGKIEAVRVNQKSPQGGCGHFFGLRRPLNY